MSLKNIPDWSQPLHIGGGEIFLAYEEPRRAYALPLELGVAPEPGGAPALSLELIRMIGGNHEPQVFGLLAVRFSGQYALSERQQELFAEHPGIKLEPLAPRGGFVRFQAAGVLDIPEELFAPRPLIWSGAGSLTLSAQLGQTATMMLHDALVNGMVTVTALAEVEAWGLASRFPAHAEFNPSELAALLNASISDGRITQTELASQLANHMQNGSISVTGVTTDTERTAAANACAERLLGRFARLSPAVDPSLGASYMIAMETMPDGKVTWDLSDKTLVPRAMVLSANPLETAKQAAAHGFTLTRDAPVIQFSTGLHLLSLYPNLPSRKIGVLMMGVEIRVPPFLPDRPQTVTGSALFRENEMVKTIPIRLSANEPVAYDYQTFAFISAGEGTQRLTGPVLHHQGLLLTLPPDSFPVQFVRVEATQLLLEAATLKIHCTGLRNDKTWNAVGTLDQTTTSLAFAVPRDVTGGTLALEAAARNGGRRRSIGPLALEDCWLDLSSFPTAGPAIIIISCNFDDAAGLVAIECAPEDRLDNPEATGLIRLTPANPSREWRWLVLNPLNDGFCWRWFRLPGEPSAPWSPPIDPGAGSFTIKSSARMEGVQ